MTEWRCLELGPETDAVGHDENHATRRREDAPYLTQQWTQGFGVFDQVRDDDPVET
jgi:hypothetical protein